MSRTISIGLSSRSAARSLAIVALGLWLVAGPVAAAGPASQAAATPESALAATISPLVTGVPPRPSHVALKVVKTVMDVDGAGYVKVRITWREPAGVATRFKVIGLIRCANSSAATDGKPCVVPHMHLRAADLRVLGTYPGTARSATVKIKLYGGESTGGLWDTSSYFGILLGAYNAHGKSVLAIVRSTRVCYGCTF